MLKRGKIKNEIITNIKPNRKLNSRYFKLTAFVLKVKHDLISRQIKVGSQFQKLFIITNKK